MELIFEVPTDSCYMHLCLNAVEQSCPSVVTQNDPLPSCFGSFCFAVSTQQICAFDDILYCLFCKSVCVSYPSNLCLCECPAYPANMCMWKRSVYPVNLCLKLRHGSIIELLITRLPNMLPHVTSWLMPLVLNCLVDSTYATYNCGLCL